MKSVFIITDNPWWLEKIYKLFSKLDYDYSCYCSPKGASLFSKEIAKGDIEVIDLKVQSDELISKFDIGFSIHCKQLFPKKLVDGVRCVNIHPGLNPYNRGWFPQVFSIINKKPVGATIHIMDEQIDHGDILLQCEVEINDWDTSKTLYDRVVQAEYKLLENNISEIIDGRVKAHKLEDKGNYNSISDYINIKEIDMDKKVTMREAIDFLRALTHPPYKNAFFFTASGEKIFVSIELEKEI